jgi:hypothetical protein
VKIGKFIRYKKLGRVIFGKINSRIQILTLGNYLFIIKLLRTQKQFEHPILIKSLFTDDRVVGRFYRDKHF